MIFSFKLATNARQRENKKAMCIIVSTGIKLLYSFAPTLPFLTPVLDAKLVHDGLLDVLRAAHHARRRAAELDEVLAPLLAVEHGVEGGHLVHLHLVLPHDFRDLLHGGQRQPAPVLQGEEKRKTEGTIETRNETVIYSPGATEACGRMRGETPLAVKGVAKHP